MRRLLLLFLIISFSFAQDDNKAITILQGINANYSAIQDFTTEIKVDINLPGFRMPNKDVKYFYKAPDKSKIESKGFAFVPKDGILPFAELVKRDSLKNLTITEIIGDTVVITLVDTFQNQEAIMTLKVHEPSATIIQGSASINNQNILTFHIHYISIHGIYLPDESAIDLLLPPDFKKIQMLGTSPSQAKKFKEKIKDNKEWVDGKIHLKFSNYIVNQGLSDEIFEEAVETVD